MRSIETTGHTRSILATSTAQDRSSGLDSHFPVSSLGLKEADGGEQLRELVNNIIGCDAFFLRQTLV